MVKKIICVILCILVGCGGVTQKDVRAQNVTVGITHGMDRIGLDDPVPKDTEVFVHMAQNEYEPFQIVMTAHTPVESAGITVTDLFNAEGHRFSRKNFDLFKVHYIYIEELSYRSTADPGWYPDGLSPLGPFSIGEQNTVVWVDVYAPVDQAPGVYAGELLIDSEPNKIAIPITIEVWGFTLPKNPSLKSGVEVMVGQVLDAHGLSWDPEELEPVLYTYYETLIKHRVMPWELYFAEPEVFRDGSIDMSENHEHLKYFMDELQVTCLIYPLYEGWPFRDPFGKDLKKTTIYLQSLHQYYTENGWEDKFYVYYIDEPNSKNAYRKVRDISEKLEEIHPDIKFMVTEQMVPDDPSWGDLFGYVDIWCPLFPCVEEEQTLIQERQKLGEEVWTYTALTQGEKETPFWELDFPVLNYRVVTWMIWDSRISGLIYWTCNWWEDVSDPWEEPGTWTEYGDVYNGEGTLVYPGEEGCLPSIRLKVLREGMEDYEYFVLLQSLQKESFVDVQIGKIAKSWYEWEENPFVLLEVRRALGEEINNAVKAEPVVTETPTKSEAPESKPPESETPAQEKTKETDTPKKEDIDSEEYLKESFIDLEDIEFEQYFYVIVGCAGFIALIIVVVYIKRKRK
ncbi:MAG: DUF4091 domain-containing protein [Candidatus Methanofastidiosia archaeon]|jgi:hypothetical protein